MTMTIPAPRKLQMFPQGSPEQEQQALLLAEKLKTAFFEAYTGNFMPDGTAPDDTFLSVARMILATPVKAVIVGSAAITAAPNV